MGSVCFPFRPDCRADLLLCRGRWRVLRVPLGFRSKVVDLCRQRLGSSLSLRGPNQPLTSPSENYVFTVPIERSKQESGPAGFGWPFWHVTISDSKGIVVYRDEEESFPGQFNVYWAWDDQDRVWLFNSDDGCVYFWELAGGTWEKQMWGYWKTRQIETSISPPLSSIPIMQRTDGRANASHATMG